MAAAQSMKRSPVPCIWVIGPRQQSRLMHSTPLIPSSRSGSPLANARIPSGTDAQITALDPLLDRICHILESLPRVSRRSLPPRGAAAVIPSYLPEQSAQVPPIFKGLRYAHPGLHPRPSSPTSGVVKRAFIFACVRVSPRHSSASRVKPTCRLSLLPETSFTLSPRPNPTAFDRTPSTTRVARR